ncbi:hypothetical protein EGW08_003959 [Elysia chlorotica]|uniref:C-type lectin domain-containing protein n=1 Tax=Elysia chlorotica TaxID=188477 RepID=A0A433U357_ELYCH|nr:hypothetical protein EGW08_003959 [Elysia chlorotica]
MASLFTLLVAAAVMAGTYGCLLETIDANVKTTLQTETQTLDKVQRLEPKINKVDDKVMEIDLRTRVIRTLQFIDVSKFAVSDRYQEKLYLISKDEVDFELEREDKACVAQGGYLLELDDEAEKSFTLDFAKKIGGSTQIAMGGNDVQTEGTWIYHHSKKPVPSSLQWINGEPNNYPPGEDCMAFKMSEDGLNDFACGKVARFICEVPLFA